MTRRPRLRDVELTSHRAAFRRTLSIVIVVTALVAAVGYVLPAHRVEGAEAFHSYLADGGPWPLVVLPLVAAITFALRRFRLGSGVLTGLVGAGGAIAALAPVILVHLFSRTEDGIGEHVFAVGELGLFFTGATLLLAEPVLYVLERRANERERQPRLPVATIAHRS